MGGRGSSCGRHLRVNCANAFEIALDSSLTHASIATSFGRSGLDGSPDSSKSGTWTSQAFLNLGGLGG
jgi:hypothetical protein